MTELNIPKWLVSVLPKEILDEIGEDASSPKLVPCSHFNSKTISLIMQNGDTPISDLLNKMVNTLKKRGFKSKIEFGKNQTQIFLPKKWFVSVNHFESKYHIVIGHTLFPSQKIKVANDNAKMHDQIDKYLKGTTGTANDNNGNTVLPSGSS